MVSGTGRAWSRGLGFAAVALHLAACAQILGIDAVHDDAPDASPGAADATTSEPPDGQVDGHVASANPTPPDATPDALADGSNDGQPASDARSLPDAATVDPALGCTGPDGGSVRFFPVNAISTYPLATAIDDSNVYVSDTNGIRACSLASCASGVTVVTSGMPRAFAVGALHVFVGDSATLSVIDRKGMLVQSFIASGLTHLVAHADEVYWSSGAVAHRLVDAPDASDVPVVTAPGPIAALAANADSLFYVVFDGAGAGSIYRCAAPACAGGASPVATIGPVDASKLPDVLLTADARSVYWYDPTLASVRACAATGCGAGPRTVLAAVTPSSLFVDATGVYWTQTNSQSPDTGTVHKLPSDGGASVLIDDQSFNPQSIVANASCVYWATPSIPSIPHGAVWAKRQP